MKTIAVISGRFSDFQAYVADIYNNSPLPKTKLGIGNKISVTTGGDETQYILVQNVTDVRGLLADGYEKLFSAYDLPEHDKIMDEIRYKSGEYK